MEIVHAVREGAISCYPLVWKPRPLNPKLDEEQCKALKASLPPTESRCFAVALALARVSFCASWSAKFR
jgi:hypothetical protein